MCACSIRSEFWVNQTLCFMDGGKMCKETSEGNMVVRSGTDKHALARRSESFSMIQG
jgi:hypothetical protein